MGSPQNRPHIYHIFYQSAHTDIYIFLHHYNWGSWNLLDHNHMVHTYLQCLYGSSSLCRYYFYSSNNDHQWCDWTRPIVFHQTHTPQLNCCNCFLKKIHGGSYQYYFEIVQYCSSTLNPKTAEGEKGETLVFCDL